MRNGARLLAALAVGMAASFVVGCGVSSQRVSSSHRPQRSAAESSGQNLRSGMPSAKILALHRLSIPQGADKVRYSIDDGWSSYGLRLTFDVPRKEAYAFLETLRVSREDLMKGFYLPETESSEWGAKKGREYVHGSSDGTRTPSDAPTYSVVLDVTDSSRTTIYLTSVVVA